MAEPTTAERAAGSGAVRGTLDRLDALTVRRSISVGDIVEAFGDTAFLPVLMVPALIVVSPLSGIPLLPTVFGAIIATVALQAVFRRQRLWLPPFLMRRRLTGARLHRGLLRLTRAADWLDGHARPRVRVLVHPPFDTVPKLLATLCGAAMPFLELVPLSSSLLGVAVLLLAAALLVEDGLYAVCGIAVMLGALSVPLLVYGGLLGLTD